MNKQQLHELPEKFSLTFLAFCGMTTDHLEDVSYQQCRDEVARILKQKRQDPETDWEINVVEPNLRWEVIDDDDPGYRSGFYRIKPPTIKGQCDQCGEKIPEGKDSYTLHDYDDVLFCREYCAEEYQREHYFCDHCGEPVGKDRFHLPEDDEAFCSEACYDEFHEENDSEEE